MEVCCYNLESALNAQAAGADRIELCADRNQGGTTPSYGMLEMVRKYLEIPVFTMIRPRGGDFLYSKEELQVMIYDIQMAKELAIDGVVMGVLQADGEVDSSVMKDLVDLARPLSITFHRAFDLTPESTRSLQTLIALGVDRVLTSGHRLTAHEGINTIKSLVELSQGKLTVLPGAGINENNLSEILELTSAREFHVSASGSRSSKMEFQKNQVQMGNHGSEYAVDIADKTRIKTFRKIADQIPSS